MNTPTPEELEEERMNILNIIQMHVETCNKNDCGFSTMLLRRTAE